MNLREHPIRRPLVVGSGLYWLAFCFCLSFMTLMPFDRAHAAAPAQDPSVEDMIGALAATPAPTAGPRMRGIGAPGSRGRLQLSIQFEPGAAMLTPPGRNVLARLADAMNARSLASRQFRIEGHTDASGDADANQHLSERRAQAVKSYLESRGVTASRLTAAGKGSSELAEPSNPRAASNRRVVIVALSDAAEAPQASTSAATPTAAPAPASRVEVTGAPPTTAGSPTVNVVVPVTSGAVGTIKQLRGDVTLARADRTVAPALGDGVMGGDLIVTGANGTVLVTMYDEAQLLVRPNTRLRLAEMVSDGPAESRSQLYDLTVGALRYVTGTLGKLQPERVRFKTPVGSVGVRGTDIEIAHFPASRGLRKAGTFVRVNSGAIELTGTDGSQVRLSINEEAFAAAQGVPLRGGGRAPAAMKLETSAGVFVPDELDGMIERK
jgi:outer membrane protein OmpA-like peptidoglycan-associated protein